MELMHQPFTDQLGERLIKLLDSGNFRTLNIAVAFAKNSGVLRLKDSIEKFRKQGGKVNVFVGVDLGGTSYEALTTLLLHTDTLNVVHTESGQSFHSKIYEFLGPKDGVIVVGSHNLTAGGLWSNFEGCAITSFKIPSAEAKKCQTEMKAFFSNLYSLGKSTMAIKKQDDIEALLTNGYVIKEVVQAVRQSKAAKKGGNGTKLFGGGTKPNIPKLSKSPQKPLKKPSRSQATSVPAPKINVGNTIWFETRSMTGGSRNILDLSMKSLVTRGNPAGTKFDLGDPKFMRGGVEFFGLNPANTGQTRNITINFDGVDYSGNTILFPSGAKANGTWRLQIKGISSSQVKITDAFKSKYGKDYLVDKIITFTEVAAGYFFMSVFPTTQLVNFEAGSQILARNGATTNARKLGII